MLLHDFFYLKGNFSLIWRIIQSLLKIQAIKAFIVLTFFERNICPSMLWTRRNSVPRFPEKNKSKIFFYKNVLMIHFIYLYIYYSLPRIASSVELLSMRVLPSLRNTYKGVLQNKQRLAIFITEGPTKRLKWESFDSKLNALTGWPRIHELELTSLDSDKRS